MFYCIGFHLTAKDTNYFFIVYPFFPFFFIFLALIEVKAAQKIVFKKMLFSCQNIEI